jgi:hypothetical protein
MAKVFWCVKMGGIIPPWRTVDCHKNGNLCEKLMTIENDDLPQRECLIECR